MDIFPLYLTLKVSVAATFFSVIIGLGLAWLMARRGFWGKGVLDALIMQPLVIPPTVLGYYLLVLLGRSSPFGRFLEDNNHPSCMEGNRGRQCHGFCQGNRRIRGNPYGRGEYPRSDPDPSHRHL